MQHYFNMEIATEYGLHQAILLQHLWFWTNVNKAKNRNFHEGYYWTYGSIREISTFFPYLSEKQIANSLKKLEAEGLIQTGNFNRIAYDRTKWYAFTDTGITIMQKGEMEKTKVTNGTSKTSRPIPYIKPDNNHIIKKRYGKYGNVSLSDSDISELKKDYSDWQSRIQTLDNYIEMTGKSYANHLLTIKTWAGKEKSSDISSYGSTKGINYDN